MTEPISVRVARLRGCDPLFVPANGEDYYSTAMWRCVCKEDGHTPNKAKAVLSTNERQSWLQPAAWALLLSEMVEGGETWGGVHLTRTPELRPDGPYAARAEWDGEARTRDAPTLGEAVALAWISWREAMR